MKVACAWVGAPEPHQGLHNLLKCQGLCASGIFWDRGSGVSFVILSTRRIVHFLCCRQVQRSFAWLRMTAEDGPITSTDNKTPSAGRAAFPESAATAKCRQTANQPKSCDLCPDAPARAHL